MEAEGPIRAVLAIRVSSEDQKERGFGHANQLRRLPELVAEQGWEVPRRPDGRVAIYDEGDASTTAASGHELSLDTRPVMQELLAELPQTQPTYLVCRALDRLHRSRLEWELLCVRLSRAGVVGIAQFPQLSGAPQIQRLENVQDQTLASIQAAFAELGKAELKTNLMNGRRERARQGLPNGGHTPYGYARPERKMPLVVVEDEANAYRQMVEWAILGWGPAKIAKALNDRGVPTRRSAHGWRAATVKRILESEAQLGMVRTWDGWIPGAGMEALIDRDRWELARAAGAERRRGNGGTNTRRHALAGLLRCSACGQKLKAQRDNRLTRDENGERRHYWNYTCKVYNSGCSAGTSISERKALRELAGHVAARLDATREWIDVEQEPADLGELEARIGELTAVRVKVEREVTRAYEAYVDADDELRKIAAATLNKRKAKLAKVNDDLEAAQREYASAQTTPTDEVVDLGQLRPLLDDWQSFDDNDKREFLEQLIDHAVVLPPGPKSRLEVVWRRDQLSASEPEPQTA